MIDVHEVIADGPVERRRATARRNAQAQAERTIERLAAGIAALTRIGVPIAAKAVERETRLSYRTITRNAGAYVLFCKHAAYFQPQTRSKVETKRAHKRALKRGTQASTRWDPLLGNTKRKLVERLRAAQERVRELELALGHAAAQQQELIGLNLALQTDLILTTKRFGQAVDEHWAGQSSR
jgi:hypothetical protein